MRKTGVSHLLWLSVAVTALFQLTACGGAPSVPAVTGDAPTAEQTAAQTAGEPGSAARETEAGTTEGKETVPSGQETAGEDPARETGAEAETKLPEETAAVPPERIYQTDNGVLYTASGSAKEDGKTFTVRSGFVMRFSDGTPGEDFNRMTLRYSSGRALRIFVTYTVSGTEKTDDFYLEAGEGVAFSGLISSYPDGAAARDLRAVRIGTCDGRETDFTLSEIRTESAAVFRDGTYDIENDRFRVGIRLAWGGGIRYIEDKTCGIDGLANLINCHDTGRLVQQSYYGTAGNSEYQAGRYNGSAWAYNPVQGGDRYGNPSRLIDLRVDGDSVYIKSQPQDWSLNDKLTKSYMENTYTVSEDVIRVDNRFIDFSGWTHPVRDQELPAFYTVSYLDRFTWYNGAEPWTGAPLFSRDALAFWGDPANAASCRFFLREGNTETWCAWTSSETGFGVGLFVPGVDSYTAGRYQYNGSKDPADDATNYVAPINRFRLVSFEPITYSYLITTGTTEEIRDTFRQQKDFASNEALLKNRVSLRTPALSAEPVEIDLSEESGRELLTSPKGTEIFYDGEQRALRLTVTDAHDPQVMIEYADLPGMLPAENYQRLEIDYMIPRENQTDGYEADFFLCTGSKQYPDGSERTREKLIRDGLWHTVTVDLGALPFWKGTVNRIRFDYFDSCSVGDAIYVRAIRLK